MSLIDRIFGYRWTLQVIHGDEVRFLVHQNSVLRILGLVAGLFLTKGSPSSPWRLRLVFNRSRDGFDLLPQHFIPDGYNLSASLQATLRELDGDYGQVLGAEPVAFDALTKKSIPIWSYESVEAMLDPFIAAKKTTLSSVLHGQVFVSEPEGKPESTANSSLRADLMDQFGTDLLIGTGTLKRDDPLVILDTRDFVSLEYAIASFVLSRMGLEFEFESQAIHQADGRAIDELVYATKPGGAPAWTETRRFFFDVTAGYFGRGGQSVGVESWPNDTQPDESDPLDAELIRSIALRQAIIFAKSPELIELKKFYEQQILQLTGFPDDIGEDDDGTCWHFEYDKEGVLTEAWYFYRERELPESLNELTRIVLPKLRQKMPHH